MKTLLCLLAFVGHAFTFAQTDYNLDFENHTDGTFSKWRSPASSTYKISVDNEVTYAGEAAMRIESTDPNAEFIAMSQAVDANYGGKTIKISGYIKTENVKVGWAGLWLRMDPNAGFDNMQRQGVKGTTDWQKYEIELPYKPGEARDIIFGGLLVGQGKMWLDQMTITIDGKTLDKAPPKKLTKAQKDTEFDTGSDITIGTLNDQKIENLALLGRVWGFLKYHHPAIAEGDLNWDYELFRGMKQMNLEASSSAFQAQLVTWIDSYPEPATCKRCDKVKSKDVVIAADRAWMQSDRLEPALSQRLQDIYDNRHLGASYYLGSYAGVGNPEFKNENPYADITYPDAGFRLLALYRYWNMIHYYFPYKDIIDKDWNAVLGEYIPRFINAKNELEYEIAAIQIIGDIQDTHANLWGGGDKFRETRGSMYPPVHVSFVEDQLTVIDYYNPEMQKEVGLEMGDVITHVNGKKVSDWVIERAPYYPASNTEARLRDMAHVALRSNDPSIEISVNRAGKTFTQTLALYQREDLNYYRWYRRDTEEPSFKMLPNNIGYISLANIAADDIPKIKKEFMNTDGIIVDIRNYPSTFVVFSLGEFFAPNGTDFVKFTTLNLNNPGEFSFGPEVSVGRKSASKIYQGKVIVLVNELSQSQAEYTSMAFRAAPNATVIGSTTAGADGNVSQINLPGGLRTMISGIGVYYPDGSPTQKVGIVPDIEVKPTVKGIREGRDELMEKAVSLILEFKD